MQSDQDLVLFPIKLVDNQDIQSYLLQLINPINPPLSQSLIMKYIKRICQLRNMYRKQLPMKNIQELNYLLKLHEEYLVLLQTIDSSLDISFGRGLIIQWKSPLKGSIQEFSDFKEELICIKINIIYLSFNLALLSQIDYSIRAIKVSEQYVATVIKQISSLLPIVRKHRMKIPELCPETLILIHSITRGIEMKIKYRIEKIEESCMGEAHHFKKQKQYVYSTYNRFGVCRQEFLGAKAKLETILPHDFVAKLQSYILQQFFYFKAKLYWLFAEYYRKEMKTQLSKQCYVCVFKASEQLSTVHNSFFQNSEIKPIQQKTHIKLQELNQSPNLNVDEQALKMEMKKIILGCSQIVGEVVHEWRDNWKQLVDEAKSTFTNINFSTQQYENSYLKLQVQLREVIESCENIFKEKQSFQQFPVDIQKSLLSIQGLQMYRLISVKNLHSKNRELISRIRVSEILFYYKQKNDQIHCWLMKNYQQNNENSNLQELEQAIYRNDFTQIVKSLGHPDNNQGEKSNLQQQFKNTKAEILKFLKQTQQTLHHLFNQQKVLNAADKKKVIREQITKFELESKEKKELLDELIARFLSIQGQEQKNIFDGENRASQKKIKNLEEYLITNRAIFTRLKECYDEIQRFVQSPQNSESEEF